MCMLQRRKTWFQSLSSSDLRCSSSAQTKKPWLRSCLRKARRLRSLKRSRRKQKTRKRKRKKRSRSYKKRSKRLIREQKSSYRRENSQMSCSVCRRLRLKVRWASSTSWNQSLPMQWTPWRKTLKLLSSLTCHWRRPRSSLLELCSHPNRM